MCRCCHNNCEEHELMIWFLVAKDCIQGLSETELNLTAGGHTPPPPLIRQDRLISSAPLLTESGGHLRTLRRTEKWTILISNTICYNFIGSGNGSYTQPEATAMSFISIQ